MAKTSHRSLLPREHGASGQIGFPLLTALASGRPGAAAFLIAAAGIAVFLAHEPALVLLGRRGPRARATDGGRARTRLGLLLAVALGAGLVGLLRSPEAVWISASLPLGLGLLLAWLIHADLVRSALGEVLVAATLVSAALPVALAGGVPPRAALEAAAVWTVSYSFSVLAVRHVVARGRGRSRAGAAVAIAAGGALWLCAWLASGRIWEVPARTVAAGIPLLLLSVALVPRPPHPRHLRHIGWALMAASTLTAILLISSQA